MFNVTIEHNFDELRQRLQRWREEIPRAAARGLNNVAFRVQREAGPELVAGLDRPTAFTEKSLWVGAKATPENLEAVIEMKPLQARYLRPLITGGARGQKVSEQRFMGRFFVPGPSAPINSAGNISKASLLRILEAATTGGTFNGGRVFVVKGGIGQRGLRPGVWVKSKRGKPEPILLFVDRAPNYGRRINFAAVVGGAARSVASDEMGRAVADALRT
ncbi:MAG: hypothetical protein U1E86_07715 [Burkholderiaceae bacterium]